MVELVDTLVSGTRAFTGVQVQVLFRATAVLYRTAFFMNKTARCYALASGVCSGHVAVSFETAFFYNKIARCYALASGVCVPGMWRFLI